MLAAKHKQWYSTIHTVDVLIQFIVCLKDNSKIIIIHTVQMAVHTKDKYKAFSSLNKNYKYPRTMEDILRVTSQLLTAHWKSITLSILG